MDLGQYRNVWIFTEQRQGVITPVVEEFLGEGRKLAKDIGTNVCAVLLGRDVSCLARELIRYGVDRVYMADHPLLENLTTDVYTKVITDATGTCRPKIVFYGAAHIGCDLTPRIAAKANTGLTADCTGLSIDPQDEKIMQTRPAFGGNLVTTIIYPGHRPQMSTVRPGVVQKLKPDDSRQGGVINVDVKLEASDIRTQVLEIVENAREMVPLTDTDVIISGDRGLGNAGGFAVTRKLVDAMGGMVGASRTTMDAGWINHSYRVGQTGTTVKPKLYAACDISRAIQHLAGMQSSNIIMTINKDSRAPIFEVANYGLVGGLYEIVPMMVEAFADEKIIR